MGGATKKEGSVRVLVTGSRNWADREAIQTALINCGATLVAHGDAKGTDSIAHEIAMSLGLDVVRFPANWNGHGKSAGPQRNRRMYDMVQPDLVLAFPLTASVGTWDMAKYAELKGCTVIVDTRYL
jgi:hypothetical protein